MNISARMKLRGHSEETSLSIFRNPEGELYILSTDNKEIKVSFDESNVPTLDFEEFDEDHDKVQSILLELVEKLHEAEAQGVEPTEDDASDSKYEFGADGGYTVRDIYVENKPFSVRQLSFLIDEGDLELNPDFQRNFVWDRNRQSLLIESMLLGLPLPSIYLSQYDDGKLTVVDGLQRITTIRRFLNNELRLSGLEYLTTFDGYTFEELKEKKILSDLQLRQFNQIQIGCFVIDYRSPDRLKFDLFRRLNTGGKPLNRPEIRNCLTRSEVQKQLKLMWNSEEFKRATDFGVKNNRMQAMDLVMRYLFFRRLYLIDPYLDEYWGKIDNYLDDFTSDLNKNGISVEEIASFYNAMENAFYIWGSNAFRKPSVRRLPVNQLLFVAFSVLLSFKNPDQLRSTFSEGEMSCILREQINENSDFRKALSTGTNARWNVKVAFETISKLINER